jgi:hypothetical protein
MLKPGTRCAVGNARHPHGLSQRHACRVAKQSGSAIGRDRGTTLSGRFLSCHEMKRERSARPVSITSVRLRASSGTSGLFRHRKQHCSLHSALCPAQARMLFQLHHRSVGPTILSASPNPNGPYERIARHRSSWASGRLPISVYAFELNERPEAQFMTIRVAVR